VYYGFKPFGQYSRKLSNSSEKLILCDAFGNTIDYVEYFSTLPWPTDANGNGYFLELINLNDDNSLSSSWTASNTLINSFNQPLYDAIVVYPSMAQSFISIKTNNQNIQSYAITDILGKVVLIGNINASQTINIESLTANIYLIRINLTDGKTIVKKFIKI
jgi:hypothetical protein